MPSSFLKHTRQPAVDDPRVIMRDAIPSERGRVTVSKQALFLLPVSLSEKVKPSEQGEPGPSTAAHMD